MNSWIFFKKWGKTRHNPMVKHLKALASILTIAAILDLHDDRGLQSDYRMPAPGRHHTAVTSGLRIHQETLRLPALPVIENLLRLPAEQHYALIATRMPMNWHHRQN